MMKDLVVSCGNLRILINRIEEALAFDLPLDKIEKIDEATGMAEAFINALNQQLSQ